MLRRRSRLAAATALAFVFAVPATAVSAATESTFAGRWTSVDAVDGSDQVMRITRGGHVVLFDSSATVCGAAPAVVTGRGTISGDDLEATLRAICLGGSGGVTGANATFTYNETDGTLVDDLGGTVWYPS
jgi:hypothetical protein